MKLSHSNIQRKLPFVSNSASYFCRRGSCWCSSDEEEAPGSRQRRSWFRIRTVLCLFPSALLHFHSSGSTLELRGSQNMLVRLFVGSAQVYFLCNSQTECSHQSRSILILTTILKRSSVHLESFSLSRLSETLV